MIALKNATIQPIDYDSKIEKFVDLIDQEFSNLKNTIGQNVLKINVCDLTRLFGDDSCKLEVSRKITGRYDYNTGVSEFTISLMHAKPITLAVISKTKHYGPSYVIEVLFKEPAFNKLLDLLDFEETDS